jgi:hypothetical protein
MILAAEQRQPCERRIPLADHDLSHYEIHRKQLRLPNVANLGSRGNEETLES